MSVIILILLFMGGLVLNPTAIIADTIKNEMAQSVTKPSFLQIDAEEWKKNKTIKQTKTGHIVQIIDPLTILLKDKSIIRLTSIDIPDTPKNTDAAFALLKEILPPDTEVLLFQPRSNKSGRVNRMGHDLAHIVTKKNSTWVQGTLLENGLARVYTAPKHDEALTEMTTAENKAITAGKNIWGNTTSTQILTNDVETLKDHMGDFVVIDATIQKVATIRNNVYLNFGQNWKTDFTVMLTSDTRKAFSKKGIDALTLSNKKIRVRGWLREYNGPLIELEDIAHLQILNADATAQEQAKPKETNE